MTTQKNTFPHPVTGETLYSREAFDAVTTQYIEDQCLILQKNIRKKSTSQNTPTAYA